MTIFANTFNFACIYQCRSILAKHYDRIEESASYFEECKKRLIDCGKNEYQEYFTTDLFELWYWQDINEDWFNALHSKSKLKKLNPTW